MNKKEKIEILKKTIEEVRPALQRDGGDIELQDVKNDVVIVKLGGKCSGCSMQKSTIDCIVLPFIQRAVSSIKKIEISE